MKEQPLTSPRPGASKVHKEQLKSFWSSRQIKMFGLTEIVAFSCSCLILVLILFSYLYFLVPARSRLNALQSERSMLQATLRKSQEIVHDGQNTQATVDKITKSMDAFENDGLLRQEQGRMTLYGELNQLIVKNALRN